jgi:light-regulated signal transduction histidine kinase (bacteriophytochrome)
MAGFDQDRAEEEIERLRKALDAETQACLDVQRRVDRANAEFEEFVSLAAHNLRQSLRDVASFSQLMAETYANRLDADAVTFVNRIREGAASMQSLLTDVVDYWATGDGNAQSSPTDMEATLRQALLSLDKQVTETSAAVTHDPLPSVRGDFEILTKVLRHLIRNAIEYRGPTSPRVHISARRAELDWVFSVADNGPGIELAFQGRVFGAFKRLHGNEYPGNGLGLAFCKKAVESQKGRTWMESSPGAGSTFYFTLPSAD